MRVQLIAQHQQLRFTGESFGAQAFLLLSLQELIVLDNEIKRAPRQHQRKRRQEQVIKELARPGGTRIQKLTERQQSDAVPKGLPEHRCRQRPEPGDQKAHNKPALPDQSVQGAQAISEHHTDQRNQPPAEDPRDQKLRIDKQVPEGQQCNPDRPTQSLKNPELTALAQGNRVACHQRRVIKTALT